MPVAWKTALATAALPPTMPENYAKHSAAFQFIKDVPVNGDQTICLNGEPGDFATIVRKDRHSDDRYLGATTNDEVATWWSSSTSSIPS